MAYPPADLPARTDGQTIDAAHVNLLDDAIRDIVTELGSGPKGGSADLTARLLALDATVGGKQPLDSDLTALAALTTTAYGRSLLEAANAAALRTLAGVEPTVGLLAGLTAEGWYVATDEDGGTLYHDGDQVAAGVQETGGRILASAARTTNYTSSGSAVEDVTGVSITFTAPTRPVTLHASARRFQGSTINNTVTIDIADDAGNSIQSASLVVPNVTGMSGLSVPLSITAYLDTLTPGNSYTYKLRTAAVSGVVTIIPSLQTLLLAREG